jgi:tetratricopeptide (TPR) repeat protein
MILARNRADCFCKTGDISAAITDYDKAISLGPEYAINYIFKAECMREKEKFTEARTLITQALQKDKNSLMAHVTMGKIEKDLKNAVLAKSYFMQAINISDTYSEPYYHLGLMSMDDAKFADAIRHFNSAISKNNTDPKNFAKRAICFAKLGMADSARADLQRAKEKFADDELITEAGMAIRMGNMPSLVPFTIQSTNKELVQYYEKANLLKRERKMGDAFKEISKAIKLDPNNSDVFLLSGEIGLISFELAYPDAQDDKKFDFEKNDYWWLAVDDLSKAIKLNSNNAAAYYFRGLAMLVAGKKKEAIKDLEKAAQLKPGNSQIEEALKNAKSK